MKTKKRFLILFATLVAVLCLAFGACSGQIKFEFETNGGTEIAAVTVEKGENFTLPTPEREGYSFEGWYDNADLTGNAITSVTAEKSMKFYAKWEQMSALKLQLDGGSLPSANVYIKAGENIYDHVKDLVPTKEGWQFGAWYLGGEELSHSATMPAEGAELTARYKVGYTVEIYEQNLEQTGYVKTEENVVGYEYITDSEFAPKVERTGFALAATPQQNEVRSLKLTEKMADNVYRLYFDRQLQTLIFAPNYPDGITGDSLVIEALYGAEVELPNAQFSVDGYFIAGWGVTGTESISEAKYTAHYIDSLVENGDGSVGPDKIVVDGETVLLAIWSKGYSDMFRGSDFIYLFDENATVCYLERDGKYFRGEYVPSSGRFTFIKGNDDVLFGRIKSDGTFVYSMETREDIVADYYKVGEEIDSSVRLLLDSMDGVTYINNTESSDGTYTIDANGNYITTFTTGELAGQTLVMRVFAGTVEGTTRIIFQIRNEEEYAMRNLLYLSVAEGQLRYSQSANMLTLDGYGNASLNTGSSTARYYYMREGNSLTLLNQSGVVYGIYELVTVGTTRGYIDYYDFLDAEFKAEDGATLTLDGIYNATYKPADGAAVSGYYSVGSSMFGDAIVSFMANDQEYVFIVESILVEGEGDEPATTVNSFRVKPAGYGEYYYTDGSYRYYSPYIVLNESEEGTASVYGYSSEGLKKIAEGPAVYNEATQAYSLTVNSNIAYPDDISRTPIDLEGIKNVVFGVGYFTTSYAAYPVCYWHSMTKDDGTQTSTDYTKTYTGVYTEVGETTEEQATLTLVSGFATLVIGDDQPLFGNYSTTDNVTTLVFVSGTLRIAYYVELDEDTNKFVFLRGFIGTAVELKADGTSDGNVTLVYDGKGGAEYVTVTPAEDEDGASTETRIKGKVEAAGETTSFNSEILCFTSDDGKTSFKYLLLTAGSNAYFSRQNDKYSGEYKLEDADFGSLRLDGYGFRAEYIAENGTVYDGQYSISAENVVRLITNEDEIIYFDLKANKEFTVRGSEYGSYLFITNQTFDSYILHFDGYGNAVLEYISTPDSAEDGSEGGEDNVTQTVGEGTYVEHDGLFTVTLSVDGKPAVYDGRIDYLTISSRNYNAFFVEFTEIKNVYLNEQDWTVLELDGCGGATRYDVYGAGEEGIYVIVSDSLIYYQNNALTDACVYHYDSSKGTIVRRNLTAQGYYTSGLDALLFSQYGYMTFNGEDDQYYYDVEANGNVTLFLRDPDNSKANKYGFVPIDIGQFDETKNFHDYDEAFTDATYYLATGYAIHFKRAEEGKDDYPVLLEEGGTERYPLTDLSFAPSGGKEFSVSAIVNINNKNYRGTVRREIVKDDDGTETVEHYLAIGSFRFDLTISYQGEGKATYSITQMRLINTFQSNNFLSTYILFYIMGGSSFANAAVSDTFGAINFITEYGKDGVALENGSYITAEFGSGSPLYGYELVKTPYSVDEETNIYSVELPEKSFEIDEDGNKVDPEQDDCKYMLHFYLSYNIYYSMLGVGMIGYDVLAFTRVETLQTTIDRQDATVTVQRVLFSDFSSYSAGSYYDVQIKVGENDLSYDLLIPFSDKTYFVVRQREQTEEDAATEGKILSSTYYELVFTEKDSGTVSDEVKTLASVAVKKYDTTVYYTELDSYAEVLHDADGNDKIVYFHYGYDYIVTECTYNAETKTYTVTTDSLRTFEIKVTDEENKTISITEVTPSTEE